jgi:hypothetical protein
MRVREGAEVLSFCVAGIFSVSIFWMPLLTIMGVLVLSRLASRAFLRVVPGAVLQTDNGARPIPGIGHRLPTGRRRRSALDKGALHCSR